MMFETIERAGFAEALSPEEFDALRTRLAAGEDDSVRQRFAETYVRLAAKEAWRYTRWCPQHASEIESAALAGLAQAASRLHPDYMTSQERVLFFFTDYVRAYVRGAIRRERSKGFNRQTAGKKAYDAPSTTTLEITTRFGKSVPRRELSVTPKSPAFDRDEIELSAEVMSRLSADSRGVLADLSKGLAVREIARSRGMRVGGWTHLLAQRHKDGFILERLHLRKQARAQPPILAVVCNLSVCSISRRSPDLSDYATLSRPEALALRSKIVEALSDHRSPCLRVHRGTTEVALRLDGPDDPLMCLMSPDPQSRLSARMALHPALRPCLRRWHTSADGNGDVLPRLTIIEPRGSELARLWRERWGSAVRGRLGPS